MGRNGQEIEAGENLADLADNVESAGTFLRIAHSLLPRCDGRENLRPVAIVENLGAVGAAGHIKARKKGATNVQSPPKGKRWIRRPRIYPS